MCARIVGLDVTYISAIPSNRRRNRPHVPKLRHTQTGAHVTDQESYQRADARRQLLRGIPRCPIETSIAAENELLFESNRKLDSDPIPHERRQIVN